MYACSWRLQGFLSMYDFLVETGYKESIDFMFSFLQLVHGYSNSDRAGIYVAVDAQMRRVRDLKDLNVYSQVEEIKERRVEAIKSVDEYIFVHDVLLEFILTRKIKNIPVEKLPSYVENARTNNPGCKY